MRMRTETHPADEAAMELEPQREVASILAAGLLRLWSRCALTPEVAHASAITDSERNCLDVSAD